MNKTLKLSFVTLLSFLLVACGADTKVKTSFQSTKDVSKGEAVYLDNQVVGEVVDVSQSGGKTHLEIELDGNGVNAVMSDAAIVVNRLKADAPLEIHNRQGNSEKVVNGQELQGLNSMFQLGAWMVGDSVDLGAEAIGDYVSAFQKYLKGDAWQKDKELLADQAKQVAKAAEVAVAQTGQELSKVVEELKKAEEPMAQAVEQIGTELAPMIGQLSTSGQSIMRELEKLTENLEKQTNQGDKELGSRFIESLNKTLETINDSMEDALPSQPSAQIQPGSKIQPNIPSKPETAAPAPIIKESTNKQLQLDVPEKVIEAPKKLQEKLSL